MKNLTWEYVEHNAKTFTIMLGGLKKIFIMSEKNSETKYEITLDYLEMFKLKFMYMLSLEVLRVLVKCRILSYLLEKFCSS